MDQRLCGRERLGLSRLLLRSRGWTQFQEGADRRRSLAERRGLSGDDAAGGEGDRRGPGKEMKGVGSMRKRAVIVPLGCVGALCLMEMARAQFGRGVGEFST